jgi:mRNA interferase MazF
MSMTPPKPGYKRSDVILVLFPHSDLRTAKPRPALIVQADNLQTGLPQVIVAMVTSKLFRASHPRRRYRCSVEKASFCWLRYPNFRFL